MATEMRLIDANRIVEVATRSYDAWNLAMATADGKREINLVYKRQELCKAVKAVADGCPTVDAVEVMHGRWIKWYPPTHMIMTGEEMIYRCSVCDAKYPDVEGYKYCPHCGSMMDKEENRNAENIKLD